MASPSDQSMVVGGGLAGMSAANAVLGNGGSVLLDTFTSDALKGEAKKPELAKVLCENSGADRFNLDLSVVAGLGGRSAPRIHRCKERFPGMTLTYALIQMVEKIAAKYLTGGPPPQFPSGYLELKQLHKAKRMFGQIVNVLLSTYSQTFNV